MEELLKELLGKKLDVNCGPNAMFRGEAVSVDNGVLKLLNEDDQDVFITIDRIAAISECKDFGSRPGFIV